MICNKPILTCWRFTGVCFVWLRWFPVECCASFFLRASQTVTWPCNCPRLRGQGQVLSTFIFTPLASWFYLQWPIRRWLFDHYTALTVWGVIACEPNCLHVGYSYNAITGSAAPQEGLSSLAVWLSYCTSSDSHSPSCSLRSSSLDTRVLDSNASTVAKPMAFALQFSHFGPHISLFLQSGSNSRWFFSHSQNP